jgi:pilus assembly protein CpaB
VTAKTKKATSLGTLGFMIAAVLFAAITGMLLSQLMENKYSRDPVKPLVVAAAPLAAGRPLRKEDVKLAMWPQSAIPAGAFAKVDQLMATKRVPLVPFVAGEAILLSHLSEPKAGIGIAPLIDRDHRAMSVRVDDPVALSRLVYPGARVDLISTIREQDKGGRPRVVARTVIQNAKVLAVGEDIDPLSSSARRKKPAGGGEGGLGMGGGGDGGGESREARGVVTLSLKPEEAERLSLATREGKIDIVLRGPHDTRTVNTSGATPLALVGDSKAQEAAAAPAEASQPRVAAKPARARRTRVIARTSSPAATKAPPPAATSSGGVVIHKGGS